MIYFIEWKCSTCGKFGEISSGADPYLVVDGVRLDHQIQSRGCLGEVTIIQKEKEPAAEPLEFPEDNRKISQSIQSDYSDVEIDTFWRLFSAECYGAVFMRARPDTIQPFMAWLKAWEAKMR